jgi:hypothetical protein
MAPETPADGPVALAAADTLLGRLQAICTALRQLDVDIRACEGVSAVHWSSAAIAELLKPLIENPLVTASQIAALADPRFDMTVRAPRSDDMRIRALAQLRVVLELLEQHPDEVHGLVMHERTHEGRVSVHIVATLKAQGLNS